MQEKKDSSISVILKGICVEEPCLYLAAAAGAWQ